jgi:hypothetical protein
MPQDASLTYMQFEEVSSFRTPLSSSNTKEKWVAPHIIADPALQSGGMYKSEDR